MENGRLIELRDRQGEVILSFQIVERPLQETPREEKGKEAPREEGKPNDLEPKMTGAQKRYLFRILAEQGKENEEAHEYLKNLFQVESLKEVSKHEASKTIDRLLKEPKGGEVDAGSPF